jgi:ribonuclease BN (tRNA processing enzyme)
MLPEHGIVLDAGTGFYRVRDHLVTDQIHVFLSHAHLDHVIGLTYLFDVLPPGGRTSVKVYGEAARLADVSDHLLAPGLFPAPLPCVFEPLAGPVTLPGKVTVRSFSLRHPGGSLGYRIDTPSGSLGFVTDTTASPDADYVEAIRGVDILIHECYFRDGREADAERTGHSCTSAVCRVAKAGQAGCLVLVHFNPSDTSEDPVGIESALQIHSHVVLGQDGMVLEL